MTLTTLYWLNLSPFYLKKEDLLEKLMEKLDKKYGPDMKILNDALPRTRTTREIDRRTQQLYNERHSFLTGKLFSEEDLTPPILISHPARNYMNKKLYLWWLDKIRIKSSTRSEFKTSSFSFVLKLSSWCQIFELVHQFIFSFHLHFKMLWISEMDFGSAVLHLSRFLEQIVRALHSSLHCFETELIDNYRLRKV